MYLNKILNNSRHFSKVRCIIGINSSLDNKSLTAVSMVHSYSSGFQDKLSILPLNKELANPNFSRQVRFNSQINQVNIFKLILVD